MKTENATHTPGPWDIFPNDNEKADIGPIQKHSNLVRTVADAWFESDEDKANARLIAAAPELLEALQAAKKMLEETSHYLPKSIRNPQRFSLLNLLANEIEPAIRKATGQ